MIKNFELNITDLPGDARTLPDRVIAIWLNTRHNYIGSGKIYVTKWNSILVETDLDKSVDSLEPFELVEDSEGSLIGIICR